MPEAYMLKMRHTGSPNVGGGEGAMIGEDVSYTLSTNQDQIMFQQSCDEPQEYVVRRLTPLECERLQAFPDGFTDLTGCDADAVTAKVAESLGYEPGSAEHKALSRKVAKWSADCPDSPRYKALGNSMTTDVIELLGRRIQAFDELHYDEVGLGGEPLQAKK